jgi:ribonuclease R
MFGRAARAVGRAFGRGTPEPAAPATPVPAVSDNRALRGKAKTVAEAAGRPAVPSESGQPRLRSKATRNASEALGRPAIPPEAKRPKKNEQARGSQPGNQAKGNRAGNTSTGPGTTGGRRKAQETAPAAKRPGRQRKPKGKA